MYAGGGRGNGSMIKLYFNHENSRWTRPDQREGVKRYINEPPFSLMTLCCSWRTRMSKGNCSSNSTEEAIEATIKRLEGERVVDVSINDQGDLLVRFDQDVLDVFATVVDDEVYENYSLKIEEQEWVCDGRQKLILES